eukprot:g2045.t1
MSDQSSNKDMKKASDKTTENVGRREISEDVARFEKCFSTFTYSANSPSEDDYVVSAERIGSKYSVLFSVMDGHGGRPCVDYLKENISSIIFGRIRALEKKRADDAKKGDVAKNNREGVEHASDHLVVPANVSDDKVALQLLKAVEDLDRGYIESVSSRLSSIKEKERTASSAEDGKSAVENEVTGPPPRKRSRRIATKYSSRRRPPKIMHSGACLLIVFVHRNHMYVCNAGDCRAVWTRFDEGDATKQMATFSRDAKTEHLSRDHKCTDPREAQLIEQTCLSDWQPIRRTRDGDREMRLHLPLRVAGSLVVTRAVGDAYLKVKELSYAPYREHVPYLLYPCKAEVTRRFLPCDCEAILVMASDGFWDNATLSDASEMASACCKGREASSKGASVDSLVSDSIFAKMASDLGYFALRRAASIWGMSLKSLLSLKEGIERRSHHDDVTTLAIDVGSLVRRIKTLSSEEADN